MKEKLRSNLNVVVICVLSLLTIYFVNHQLAEYLLRRQDMDDFGFIFLGANSLLLLLISGLVFFLYKKRYKGLFFFINQIKLRDIVLFSVPFLLIIIFEVKIGTNFNINLYKVGIGVMIMLYAFSSELFLRGYLTREFKNLSSNIRPLLIGGIWLLILIAMLWPYTIIENLTLNQLTSNKLALLCALILAILIIYSWFLDRTQDMTNSIWPCLVLSSPFYVFILSGVSTIYLQNDQNIILFLVVSLFCFIWIGCEKLKSISVERYAKPISKLTYFKTIKRRVRDGIRKYHYEDRTFKLNYDPRITDAKKRVVAKLIDLIFMMIIGYMFYIAIHREFLDGYELLAVGGLLLLLINPLSEAFFGTTIGKYIFGFCVIDDYLQKPNIKLSYKRNILSILEGMPFLRIVPGGMGDKGIKAHNIACHTYIVPVDYIPEIREWLKNAEKSNTDEETTD